MAQRQDVSVVGGAAAPAPAAPMCANSCGFFGSAATENFSSKCYKEHLTIKTAAAAPFDEKKIKVANAKAAAGHVMPEHLAPGGGQDPAAPAAAAATATPPVSPGSPTAEENGGGAFKTLMKLQLEASCRRGGVIECANGCGYFGCAANNNLCTLCYRDFLKNAPASATPAAGAEARPAPTNRCSSCRKKVGLLGFPCRCGATFCALHRHAEKHACDFDFKTAGREKIAKNNPIVVAAKINMI